ncbi:MAG: peptide deformylase [Chloroflexi bacterium]|nr:peptide deformylase [Chloroflexota bacterium]
MAVKNILVVENPILRKKSKKVRQFDGALQKLADDMLETMRAANGLGLAAPQIGVLQRLIVIEMPPENEEVNEGELAAQPRKPGKIYVVCNPEITHASGEEEMEEGCLSVPGYVGSVARASRVTVRGQNLKGKGVRIEADGLLARAFQHEIDHLDGILFLDRVASPDKLRRVEAARQGPPAPSATTETKERL